MEFANFSEYVTKALCMFKFLFFRNDGFLFQNKVIFSFNVCPTLSLIHFLCTHTCERISSRAFQRIFDRKIGVDTDENKLI